MGVYCSAKEQVPAAPPAVVSDFIYDTSLALLSERLRKLKNRRISRRVNVRNKWRHSQRTPAPDTRDTSSSAEEPSVWDSNRSIAKIRQDPDASSEQQVESAGQPIEEAASEGSTKEKH
eukprot:CAMPEP_0167788152 /NCGR_PEP_ID=MMETSP0111_2-20121227/9862_1 /TAXON_ID=91324 /ORGANISM="Lotharella globosa, Strain CCCM811" /LENGTH=118 /DNA_ID=CAMNT_0007679959 /DNA_START=43 /DNA_END=399 /DNA_ORIENTATION=-